MKLNFKKMKSNHEFNFLISRKLNYDKSEIYSLYSNCKTRECYIDNNIVRFAIVTKVKKKSNEDFFEDGNHDGICLKVYYRFVDSISEIMILLREIQKFSKENEELSSLIEEGGGNVLQLLYGLNDLNIYTKEKICLIYPQLFFENGDLEKTYRILNLIKIPTEKFLETHEPIGISLFKKKKKKRKRGEPIPAPTPERIEKWINQKPTIMEYAKFGWLIFKITDKIVKITGLSATGVGVAAGIYYVVRLLLMMPEFVPLYIKISSRSLRRHKKILKVAGMPINIVYDKVNEIFQIGLENKDVKKILGEVNIQNVKNMLLTLKYFIMKFTRTEKEWKVYQLKKERKRQRKSHEESLQNLKSLQKLRKKYQVGDYDKIVGDCTKFSQIKSIY